MTPAPDGPQYVYRATLARVVDGDTWELTCDLGFRTSAKLMVRLRGYSCPELSETGGPEAAYAAEALLTGRSLLMQSYRDRVSFARWIADVWVLAERWESVGERLVASGHAVRVS